MGCSFECKFECKTALTTLLFLALIVSISSCSSNKDFFTKINNYETRNDGAIRVTNCSGMNSCQNPVFSPDGKEIIFTRFMKGYNKGPSEIVRLNLETGREKVIVENESDNVNIPYGSWIGNKIIFSSDREGIDEIYSGNDGGGKVKRITAHYSFEGYYIEPAYNPVDTKLIIFEYARENGEHSLKLLDLASKGGLSDLTNSQEYDDRLPSFSPDGKSIAWQRTKIGQDNWRIYTADLDLQPKPRLSNTRVITPAADSGHDYTDPSWLWNGKYLLASVSDSYIGAFPLNKSQEPIRITFSSNILDSAPSNSRDSRLAAFESRIDNENELNPSQIWIIRIPQKLWNESYEDDDSKNEKYESKLTGDYGSDSSDSDYENDFDDNDSEDFQGALDESNNLNEELDEYDGFSADEIKDLESENLSENSNEYDAENKSVDLPSLSDRNIQIWHPFSGQIFQWQFAGDFNSNIDADVYHLDGMDTDIKIVQALHVKGKKVVCYINTGAWEDWRSDKDFFPSSVIGKDYSGWAGEKWLDIRKLDVIAPIMEKRFDICKEKGFDAIEPDNIDGYLQDTGFAITYEDQIKFNKLLAEKAHERGMSIGLKNDGDQAKDLAEDYDFGITESCFTDDFCEEFKHFSDNKKAVAMIEYTDTKVDFSKACNKAKELGFSAVLKNRNLDEFRKGC